MSLNLRLHNCTCHNTLILFARVQVKRLTWVRLKINLGSFCKRLTWVLYLVNNLYLFLENWILYLVNNLFYKFNLFEIVKFNLKTINGQIIKYLKYYNQCFFHLYLKEIKKKIHNKKKFRIKNFKL